MNCLLIALWIIIHLYVMYKQKFNICIYIYIVWRFHPICTYHDMCMYTYTYNVIYNTYIAVAIAVAWGAHSRKLPPAAWPAQSTEAPAARSWRTCLWPESRDWSLNEWASVSARSRWYCLNRWNCWQFWVPHWYHDCWKDLETLTPERSYLQSVNTRTKS